MSTHPEHSTPTGSGRLSAMGLFAIHGMALLTVYFVPVFICPTVVEHYATIGVPETPLFFRAHLISDVFVAYTFVLLAVATVYLVLIYRLARSGKRWLPALSNTSLLAIALFGMLYTAWLINPMSAAIPNAAVAVDDGAKPKIVSAVARNDR